MAVNKETYQRIRQELDAKQVTLVAVSKIQPVESILKLYEMGQRDFGENYVQELVDKQTALPKDIRWHFIGHLQSNKVKFIAPFVQLIHGVDSFKLLKEINKEASKNNRVIDVLLQVHIAQEETKFGLNEEELNLIIQEFENLEMSNIRICGLMGMASFSDDMEKVRREFQYLKMLFTKSAGKFTIHHSPFTILSMGMSGDYTIAIEEGSTMVRIGSLLFGARNYAT
ncbi:MAG TPA: YggS family pyridoxal phosphate-dependent enzyme [Lacibacter sp.]|nr:YggS family pyridoxal phosphate-dependent enzyme [Lacibacter sp.]